MRKETVAAVSGFVCCLLLNLSAHAQDPIPATESLEHAFPEQRNYSPIWYTP
jgi:hypothetical protein